MAVRSNFKAVLERIRKAVVQDTVAPEQLKQLGDEAIRLIQVRTRLGFGVDGPGLPRKKLKPLSDRYIEMRVKSKKLSDHTAPGRSNLTHTGQLLDSLKVIIRKMAILIEPTGQRSDGQTNQDAAASAAAGGRHFISLSDLEIKKLKRFYENTVLGKALKRRGLTR